MMFHTIVQSSILKTFRGNHLIILLLQYRQLYLRHHFRFLIETLILCRPQLRTVFVIEAKIKSAIGTQKKELMKFILTGLGRHAFHDGRYDAVANDHTGAGTYQIRESQGKRSKSSIQRMHGLKFIDKEDLTGFENQMISMPCPIRFHAKRKTEKPIRGVSR